VALVVLAIVVALVAVDAIARLDERKPRDDEERDPASPRRRRSSSI